MVFPNKADVDENFFCLAQRLLSPEARQTGLLAAFATYSRKLIAKIAAWAAFHGLDPKDLEFQMFYGIHTAEQSRLARKGYRSQVLVSYGSHWFAWFMRRLRQRSLSRAQPV